MPFRNSALAFVFLLSTTSATLAQYSGAPVIDYNHRSAARPDCRTMRVDEDGRMQSKFMCRGTDGEWYEADDDSVEGPGAAAGTPPAYAAAETASPTLRSVSGARSLTMRLSNIDDLGLVIVLGADGSYAVAGEAQWNVLNQGGAADVPLDGRFSEGRNTVLFVLHNKAWALGSTSKWAFNAALVADGSTLWHDAYLRQNVGPGIQYWTAFSVWRRRGGTLDIDKATVAQLRDLQPRMSELNATLIRDYGTEQSVYLLAAGVAVAAIVAGMAGSSDSDSGRRTSTSRGYTSDDSPGEEPGASAARPLPRSTYEAPAHPAPEPDTYGLYGNCHNEMGCSYPKPQ